MSFPRDRGNYSPQVYSTLLLIAAIKQHGGELRLPALLLESVKGGESVMHDYDSSTQELVLRCGSAAANLLALPQEDKWEAPARPLQPPAPPPSLNPSIPRSTADDQRTLDLEKARAAERLVANLHSRRETLRDLFSPTSEEALKKGGSATG